MPNGNFPLKYYHKSRKKAIKFANCLVSWGNEIDLYTLYGCQLKKCSIDAKKSPVTGLHLSKIFY